MKMSASFHENNRTIWSTVVEIIEAIAAANPVIGRRLVHHFRQAMREQEQVLKPLRYAPPYPSQGDHLGGSPLETGRIQKEISCGSLADSNYQAYVCNFTGEA
jgi:hypothetical protein